MNILKSITVFLNELRLNSGAIWMEKESIKFSAPLNFQNQETDNFILHNKSKLITILKENHIFSKQKFLSVVIFRDKTKTYYPLSFAQERLWFIEQYEEGTNAYHIPELYEFNSNTDVAGIKYALQQVVSRHEVLRTTVGQEGDLEYSTQSVHNEPLIIEEVILTDKDDYKTLLKEDINRPFNLSVEYPIRATLYTIQSSNGSAGNQANKTLLLINTHHIASDGWSIEIFQKELFTYYEAYLTNNTAFSLPALEIQYKDYAVWQRAYLTGAFFEKQLSYWKHKLSGYQTLKLPTDYTRPNDIDYRGSNEEFTLSKEISQKLRSLAQRMGVTLHSTMLSSINILLNKYTGQDDIVVGSVIANRHHQQTEQLIGFFVNTQANRTLLNKSQSYEALVQQVQQQQIEAQLYQDLPFEKVVDELGVERDSSRHPVFQVMFGVQSFGNDIKTNDQQKTYLKPLQIEDIYEVAQFDLSISIDDGKEELLGQINYATSLFHRNTIVKFIHHYTYLLDQLTKAPEKAYSEISLPIAEEYNQDMYKWSNTDNESMNAIQAKNKKMGLVNDLEL